jgi:RNA polymerase sigma-70 factor, ECF subfamily
MDRAAGNQPQYPLKSSFQSVGPKVAMWGSAMTTNTLIADCIELAQQGDPGALSQLALLSRPLIERQLLRYPLSDEDRSDVAQSALMQVVRRIGSFRGQASFTTWLFRVTANEALMLMRSLRRQRARMAADANLDELEAGVGGDELTLDGSAIELEREAATREALEQLPPHYRDVVTAHYHDELGLQQIADRMNVSESAVRSRLHRARSRLRALLSATPQLRELTSCAA